MIMNVLNVIIVTVFVLVVGGLCYSVAKKTKSNKELADDFGVDKDTIDAI